MVYLCTFKCVITTGLSDIILLIKVQILYLLLKLVWFIVILCNCCSIYSCIHMELPNKILNNLVQYLLILKSYFTNTVNLDTSTTLRLGFVLIRIYTM